MIDGAFLTEWFGLTGAVLFVIFTVFKLVWPKIEKQMDIRTALKTEENRLRKTEQENTKKVIEAVNVTNQLVAKNNEAFSKYNTIFEFHNEVSKELRDSFKDFKVESHRRFDGLEDKLAKHNENAVQITQILQSVLTNMERLQWSAPPPSHLENKEKAGLEHGI